MSVSVIRRLAACLAVAVVLASPLPAQACPMCKLANESTQKDEEVNRRPKAYMYSILFMISMPATLLSSFGIGFYRVWKKNGGGQSGPLPGEELED